MQKFYHHEIQAISGLVNQLNTAMEQYSRREYHADDSLRSVLDQAIITYKGLGKTERESQFQAMRAELVTALKGVNPLTYERANGRRMEMISTISYKIMQTAEGQFRMDIEQNRQKLTQASELISQIIVAAIQGGKLTDAEIKKIKTTADADKTWKQIGTDANINLGQKRVLLQVSVPDALLLFDDLLTPFKQ